MSVNIELPYFGILIFIYLTAPLLCVLVTLETNRHMTRAFRRDMKRREKALKEGNAALLKSRQEVDRDATLNRQAAAELEEQKRQFEERKNELGRAAQDMSTQAKLAIATHGDTITMPKQED